MKSIAVVLCGSGFLDGSEIRESVGALWALSHYPVQVQCYAPDREQFDVVNCLTRRTVPGETRNLLVEASRIARGKVIQTTKLNPMDHAAVVFPGGFGVAKNLCTFATEGARGMVLPEIKDVIKGFYEERKPIGAICISPALIALALPGKKLTMTLGDNPEMAQELEKIGHVHQVAAPDECVIDREHKVISTPAYMYDDAPLNKIFTGIQKLVEAVITLA